jgi:Zn-dependent M28 family amino/carboxypeptidase
MIRSVVAVSLGAALLALVGCGGDSPPAASSPALPIASVTPPPVQPTSAAPSASAAPNAPQPSAFDTAALSTNRAEEVARSLAVEVGPRLAGSAGDKLAVAWGLKTMTAAGLTNVHAEAVTAPVWKRGVETAEIVSPIDQKLAITALGWSGATPKEGVSAEVIEVDDLDTLAKLPKGSAKGKIIFANPIMKRTADGSGYGAAVPLRGAGPKLAMDAGALAFVIRTVGTAEDRFPHAGAASLSKVKNPIAAGAISTVDAELLHDQLTKHADLKLKIVLTPSREKDAATANIVGEIPGTTRKDEVVLLGAHLDSWDLGRGAIDDAAGCGIVLEAARLVGEHARADGKSGPARTIRVVFFAAEENSGAGGKAYASAHAAEIAKHVVAIEADFGTDKVLAVRFMGPSLPVYDQLASTLLPLGISRAEGEGHPGSDVTPLVELGVPTVDLRQDGTRYFDLHHSANDTEDKLDAKGMAQTATALADVAYQVSEMQGDLGRAPPQKEKP